MTDKKKLSARDMAYMGLFAALIAVCSWISIPAAVPFTLQTFAVFLAAGFLGAKRALLTVAAYLLLGAIGAPVFSGFRGGPGALVSTTGGYLIGFLFTALITGLIVGRFGRRWYVLLAAMAVGLLACYIFGTAWFMLLYTAKTGPISLAGALSWCVLPFILPDALKIALAALLTNRLAQRLRL